MHASQINKIKKTYQMREMESIGLDGSKYRFESSWIRCNAEEIVRKVEKWWK